MKSFVVLLTGLVLTGPALAQTVLTLPRNGRDKNNQPLVLPRDVELMGGTKADALNGVLTTPKINGGTLSAPQVNTSLQMSATGEIVFVPRGSPIAGSRAGSLAMYTLNHSVQEFADARECDSYTHSPALGGNVCHYTYMRAQAGSGQLWARNAVVETDPAFNGALYSLLVDELDINNYAHDYGDFSNSNGIGMLFNGLGKMNTAAISVQTGNMSGVLPIWYYGVHCGPSAVKSSCFHDASNSEKSIYIQGTHSFAVDLADANTATGAAIRLGNNGVTQGIAARVIDSAGNITNVTGLYFDAGGYVHIGSPALQNWTSEGNIIPAVADRFSIGVSTNRFRDVQSTQIHTAGLTVDNTIVARSGTVQVANIQPLADNTYSLGMSTARYANTQTLAINNIPVMAPGTPVSTSACIAGQQMFDTAYLYICVSTNVWRRASLSAF